MGYGAGATQLAAASSDSNGNFKLPLSCPSSSSQLYMVATGGEVHTNSCTGAPAASNSALALMAALGTCGSLPAVVKIDEATTVASVWALNQFMNSTGQDVGTSATNPTGLKNAVAAVSSKNLVDVTTGFAPSSFPTWVKSPTQKLYSLADILAPCVGASGASAAACTSLFTLVTPAGATNTLAAALDIARNPGHNVKSLFNLAVPNSPFGPSLASAPTDWNLGIEYTGGGVSSHPDSIAVDSAGNVWTSNCGDCPTSSVSKLSPIGVPLSPSTGYTASGLVSSRSIAVDQAGNAWIGNCGGCETTGVGGNIIEFAPGGSLLSPASGYTGGGQIQGPGNILGVAIDASGNVWVVNSLGPSASELCGANPARCPSGLHTGDGISPSCCGYTGGGLQNGPEDLAIDAAGNVWVSALGGLFPSAVAELNSKGDPLSPNPSGYTPSSLNFPFGIGVDPSGNVWAANCGGWCSSGTGSGADSVTELCGANTAKCPAGDKTGGSISPSPSGYTGGGLSTPQGLAIDSVGNVWLANCGSVCAAGKGPPPNVTELNSSGTPISPSSGYTGASLLAPWAVAIDPSGNVWVTNFNPGNSSVSSGITELIGAASPVKTPLIGPPTKP